MAKAHSITPFQMYLPFPFDPCREEWRAIVGYEGLYEVSNFGQVRSLDREVIAPTHRAGSTPLKLSGKILKQGKSSKSGLYRTVALSKEGKVKYPFVHHLVLEAFVGPKLPGLICNHKDNNPSNNLLTNLEWCTPRENTQHALAQGRLTMLKPQPGEKHPRALFTNAQVLTILGRVRSGATITALAQEYGVSYHTIWAIVRRRNWAEYSEPEEWRPVVGYEESYLVSSLGRVRSLARYSRSAIHPSGVRLRQGRVLKPAIAKHYLFVSLHKDGRHTSRYIHHLVLEAFVGLRPEGQECNHIDGNPANNSVTNLEWVTGEDNLQHARRMGLFQPNHRRK